jgi:hypothetical protein
MDDDENQVGQYHTFSEDSPYQRIQDIINEEFKQQAETRAEELMNEFRNN